MNTVNTFCNNEYPDIRSEGIIVNTFANNEFRVTRVTNNCENFVNDVFPVITSE